MDEIWKPVRGFETVAEVSNTGRVRTVDSVRVGIKRGVPVPQRRKGGIVSPYVARNGYVTFALKIGAKRPKLLLHRVLAQAFVPGEFPGAHVNHINGVKTDNRLENLEWLSATENTRHQWQTGLVDLRGERHPSAKLSADAVRTIRAQAAKGASLGDLARWAGVSYAAIKKVILRETWDSIP